MIIIYNNHGILCKASFDNYIVKVILCTSAAIKAKVSRPAGSPQAAAAPSNAVAAVKIRPSRQARRTWTQLPVFGEEDSWETNSKILVH